MPRNLQDLAARHAGWGDGVLGMLIFSGSLPATRIAVGTFDPLFLTCTRAAVAGVFACGLLAAFDRRRPSAADLRALAVVALGVVVGFPLLTALALQRVTSAHAIVFTALLPLATAVSAVLRARERPSASFWAFALGGSAIVAGYAVHQAGGLHLLPADLLMLAALAVCGLGYAEGARLSRTRSGWSVISWALVLALPLMFPLALVFAPHTWTQVRWPAIVSLAYVSLFSMLIGFVFWYRGLARGGVAAVGQLQLIQPFLGLTWAACLLHEPVSWTTFAMAAAVVACVAASKRMASHRGGALEGARLAAPDAGPARVAHRG